MPMLIPQTKAQRRILVVDNNRDGANSLAAHLTLSGHQVQVAYNPLQAHYLAADFEPHLVLMGIAMAGVAGLEAGQQMCISPWGKTILLIVVNGTDAIEVRDQAEQVGFDAHFLKPGKYESLIKTIESMPHVE